MKLALVTQDFPPRRGGIQTWALEIAKELQNRVERLLVIAPNVPGAEQADREHGLEVIRTGSPNTLIAACGPALARVSGRGGVDHTLHAQWSTAPAAEALRALGRLRRVAIAAHGRELLLEPWPAPFQSGYDAVRRRALSGADVILAGSAFTARLARALGAPEERLRVTRYGTDPERFSPRDAGALRARLGLAGRPLLVTIARLVERKGVDRVLEALPRVRAELSDVTYVVAGDGPDRGRLERLASELGVGDCVRFTGELSDGELGLYYSLGDVFVMPSRSVAPDVEGFGIVFLEAAACERPVIASREGGVEDAIADGVTGVLVPPDDKDALARAILELLRDPERRRELGRRGRERVLAELTWPHVAERTIAALRGEESG